MLGRTQKAPKVTHVPREEQPALVGRIYDWLRAGGAILANWAPTSWEGEEEDWEGWGAPMWWSHYGAEENLAMLRGAGFAIERAETLTGSGETWLWVQQRRAGPFLPIALAVVSVVLNAVTQEVLFRGYVFRVI